MNQWYAILVFAKDWKYAWRTHISTVRWHIPGKPMVILVILKHPVCHFDFRGVDAILLWPSIYAASMSCKHVRIEKLKKLSRRLLCRIYAHQQQTTLALIRIILIVHSSSTALQLLRSEPTTRSSNMADLKKIMEMAAILSKKVRYVDGHGEERLLYCVSMRVDGTFQLSKSNLTSICHSKMFAGTRTHTVVCPCT